MSYFVSEYINLCIMLFQKLILNHFFWKDFNISETYENSCLESSSEEKSWINLGYQVSNFALDLSSLAPCSNRARS